MMLLLLLALSAGRFTGASPPSSSDVHVPHLPDTRFWAIAEAVVLSDDVAADPDLVCALSDWFDGDIRILSLLPVDLALDDFLTASKAVPSGATPPPILAVSALLRMRAIGAISAAALLLTLISRRAQLAALAADLALELVVGLSDLGAPSRLLMFFDPILTAISARSEILTTEPFWEKLLDAHTVLYRPVPFPRLVPFAVDLWRGLFRIWSRPQLKAAAAFASRHLRSVTVWATIFVEAVIQAVHNEVEPVADLFRCRDVVGRPHPGSEVEILAELAVRSLQPLSALVQLWCRRSLDDKPANQRPKTGHERAREALRRLQPSVAHHNKKAKLDAALRRLPVADVEQIAVQTIRFMRESRQQSLEIGGDQPRFLGLVHRLLLLRSDMAHIYGRLSIFDSASIALLLATPWVKKAAVPVENDIVPFVARIDVSDNSPPSHRRRQLELIGRSWPFWTNYEPIVEHLLVAASSVSFAAVLIDTLFRCSSADARKAPFLQRRFLEMSARGQLQVEEFRALRDRLWAMFYAEDQAELKHADPDLFECGRVRSDVTGDVREQFTFRIDDQCVLCLEALLACSGDKAEALSALYRMPCGEHFLHRRCAETYMQAMFYSRMETCFFCFQSIPRPPPLDP